MTRRQTHTTRRGTRRAAALCTALAASTLMSACGEPHEELQGWMDQQRREVKPNVQPIAAPSRFDPQPYTGAALPDPFTTQKLSVAITQEVRQTGNVLASEMNRRKEPLEAFPLDGMAMVGSVIKFGQRFALLRVDNLLYQVKVGDYVGQNYGRITKIDETQVAVREIAQDAAGEWIERPATLQLQEKAQ